MQCVYIGQICQALCWPAQLFEWQCPTNSIPQTSYSTAILCLRTDIAIWLELAISHTSSSMRSPLIQSRCLFNPQGPAAIGRGRIVHTCLYTLSFCCICPYRPKKGLQKKQFCYQKVWYAPNNIIQYSLAPNSLHLSHLASVCSIHNKSWQLTLLRSFCTSQERFTANTLFYQLQTTVCCRGDGSLCSQALPQQGIVQQHTCPTTRLFGTFWLQLGCVRGFYSSTLVAPPSFSHLAGREAPAVAN